jgi:hypothetical protein
VAALFVVALTTAACGAPSGGDIDVEALLRDDVEESPAVGGSDTTVVDATGAPDGTAAEGGGQGGATGAGRRSATTGGGGGSIAGVPGARSTAGGAKPAGGPGVTDSEIKVGFMVTANLQAGFAAIGASGQPPDEIDLYRVMVDWANAHGGIGGRKVVPVFAETDALSNWQAQAQAVCARFTEDERVAVAVTSVVGGNDALATCLIGKGVPVVEQNHWLWDGPYLQRLGHLLFQPSRMRPDRAIPAGVATLAEGGYFGSGHRLGVLRFDGPVFERLSRNVLRPALAANGGNLVEEVAIATPGGASDFGGMSAQIGNAIIRFRSQQVTHVMFLENAGILPFFWNHEASSQGFYPRLGLMSSDLPATQASQASPRVLQDSLAAGWAPSLDSNMDPDLIPPNPALEACMGVMEKAGVSNEFGLGFYISAACDAMFFLKSTLDNASALTGDGMRTAVEKRGGTYVSPYTFPRTQLGPGRHDGATMMALARYEEAPCDCYRYITPARAVP